MGEEKSMLELASRGNMPLDPVDAQRVRAITREDLLSMPRQNTPMAELGGSMRIGYTGIRGTNSQIGLMHIPVGQASPVHNARLEHLIMVLIGEVEFTIQEQTIRVLPWGQIFLPADVLYAYKNVGTEGAWFMNCISRYKDWPSTESADYKLP
jgi:quercetin dioxygenase-like cupin family protein